MTKAKKAWIIASAVLIVIGIGMAAVGIFNMDFDFTRLDTMKYTEKTYSVSNDFSNIKIDTVMGKVSFEKSEDGKCTVACFEGENTEFSVNVVDSTLYVIYTDNRKWYQHIGVSFGSPDITVYLPKTAYERLEITTVSDDIELSRDFTFSDVAVESTSGKIYVNSCIWDNFSAKTVSGDITLNRINVSGNISTETVSGNLKFTECDAEKISFESTSGDVKGSVLTDKLFDFSTVSGDVELPKSAGEQICKIRTTSGNIKIEIAE